jgi:hypothetical protein
MKNNMKTIWVRIFDGDNVIACSTKKKALESIADDNPDMTVGEAKEVLESEWQEVSVD